MNKLIALSRNEWTKTIHHIIVYVILLFILLGILGIASIYRVINNSNQQNYEIRNFSEVQSEIEDNQTDLINRIDALEKKIQKASENGLNQENDDFLDMKLEWQYNKSELMTYQLAIENQVNIYNQDYLSDLIYELKDLILALKSQEMAPNSESDNFIDNLESDFLLEYGSFPMNNFGYLNEEQIKTRINQVTQLLEQPNYSKYISLEKKHILENSLLSEMQKQDQLFDLDLKLKTNPNGLNYYPGFEQISNWKNIRDESRQSLALGYNQNFEPLNQEQMQKAENDLNIVLSYLDETMLNDQTAFTSNYSISYFCLDYGTYMIIFLIIILAGGAIAHEISSGSIKGLIIAPVKRSKIFFAKLFNTMLIGLVGMLFVYFITLISSLALLHIPNNFPYGNFSFPIYLLFRALSKLPFIWIAGFFALCLSAITRNTSIAVGFSMILQFGVWGIYHFIKLITNNIHAIFAFLPMEYLDLSNYLIEDLPKFLSNSYLLDTNQNFFTFQVPIWIPFLYWIFLSLALIWIARDSFVQKDL